MLNLLHIMVTALKSKSYGIGWHMKGSRPFTMDQAGMISYRAVYIATSYSARHSSRRLFKFVFTKDLTEMSWLRFSTAICQIVEFSSSIWRLFKYVFTIDLTDMTRFSFSTAIFHIVEHSNRRLFKYVFHQAPGRQDQVQFLYSHLSHSGVQQQDAGQAQQQEAVQVCLRQAPGRAVSVGLPASMIVVISNLNAKEVDKITFESLIRERQGNVLSLQAHTAHVPPQDSIHYGLQPGLRPETVPVDVIGQELTHSGVLQPPEKQEPVHSVHAQLGQAPEENGHFQRALHYEPGGAAQSLNYDHSYRLLCQGLGEGAVQVDCGLVQVGGEPNPHGADHPAPNYLHEDCTDRGELHHQLQRFSIQASSNIHIHLKSMHNNCEDWVDNEVVGTGGDSGVLHGFCGSTEFDMITVVIFEVGKATDEICCLVLCLPGACAVHLSEMFLNQRRYSSSLGKLSY